MRRMLGHKTISKKGFTIVEMAIVAPVVVLVIGAFITTIVTLMGDAVVSRAANQLAYNLQDSLGRIEQDVKTSSLFLEANSIALTTPQGLNNDTTVFKNVTSTTTLLILSSTATTTNPFDITSTPVYLANTPNACANSLVIYNTKMPTNIVYFISGGTLWRRTILQSDYATAGCSTPWQQPSCAIGQVAAFCKTQDVKLLDGVTSFAVTYYATANSNTALTVPSDYNSSDAARHTALLGSNTISVSINASTTAGGRTVTRDGSIRVTLIN